MGELTLERLQKACAQDAAIRRTARLQPAGGVGDKVFPPTYEGGEYALENRVIEGARVPCVLLDSVQSQANRLEEVLLQAVRDRQISIPVLKVEFTKAGLPEVGDVTSLDAPHRLADAILRDSLVGSVGFRESEYGKVLDEASYTNATGLYRFCPTALIFGLWDSAGPRGGSGTKFARALVSEIVGVDAETGLRPTSRLDPLGIQLDAGKLYELKDGGWTLDPNHKGVEKEKSKAKLVGKDGKPSEANHGNVTPSLKSDKGVYHHGGVTFVYARQATVLSLPALRRLRFPVGDKLTGARDEAARVVLAALGLTATVLSAERGTDLRSRCLLVPEEGNLPRLEIVTAEGKAEQFVLTSDRARALLADATKAAAKEGLEWIGEVALTPKPELVELVKRSRAVVVGSGAAEA